MNALIPAGFGAPTTQLDDVDNNELMGGITSGFAVVGYKGKTWSIRKGGEETKLMRSDGDGPRASIEVVIVRASSVLSKTWYANGWTDGQEGVAPDCFSTNGSVPDPAAKMKQHANCAACPRNQFGTRVNQNGEMGKGKACGDFKRLAVVPLGDLHNEMYGGPMLLRVPAASLAGLQMLGSQLEKIGHKFAGVGVRVSFDVNESYPKLLFAAIRPLSPDEIAIVREWRNDPMVTRILSEELTQGAATPQVTAETVFEQPPAEAQTAAPAKATPAQTKPKTTPKVEPAKVAPEPEVLTGEIVDDLDAKLDALLPK